MIMVENLAPEATNQMLRDLFAEFYPKRCRIVYRNSIPKGTPTLLLSKITIIITRLHITQGFAGIDFEREDQALAACRQRSGALVLGRPITCR
jgi:RNA recognition motif-containing protein